MSEAEPTEVQVKDQDQEAERLAKIAAVEQIVLNGDYGALNKTQRAIYVESLCQKLGISWHTRPFDWIILNGKLTLYANRNCYDQLRATRGISIEIIERQQIHDVFVVRARATMPDGRTDESLGSVSLIGKVGEDLANALMRAETKAKRRVTSSISGTSFLDETEVQDIPNRQSVPQTTGVRRVAPPPLQMGGEVRLEGSHESAVDAVLSSEGGSDSDSSSDSLQGQSGVPAEENLSLRVGDDPAAGTAAGRPFQARKHQAPAGGPVRVSIGRKVVK